jgi:two-component system, LytTR family, sensor kinase
MNRFWKYNFDHIIFWTATVVFHMFTRLSLLGEAGVGQFFFEIIIRNGLLALMIYANLLVLIPRFLSQKRIAAYSVGLIIAVCGYILLKNLHDQYLQGYILQRPEQHFFQYSYYNFSIALFYLAFSIALHLSKAWYFQREQLRRIAMEKLTAELDYLKAQINPHFVFNAINTIYFQIDKQNTTARETLSVFSDLLRYQLYECNGDQIAIEKEVTYLRNYVAMQKLRRDEQYQIMLTADQSLTGFSIAPLLIIPFVENAFKHVSHYPQGNAIRIELSKKDDRFYLTVFNTRDDHQPDSSHEGIGLKNVKRRLALLYPQHHMLDIRADEHSFKVSLEIKIDDV